MDGSLVASYCLLIILGRKVWGDRHPTVGWCPGREPWDWSHLEPQKLKNCLSLKFCLLTNTSGTNKSAATLWRGTQSYRNHSISASRRAFCCGCLLVYAARQRWDSETIKTVPHLGHFMIHSPTTTGNDLQTGRCLSARITLRNLVLNQV